MAFVWAGKATAKPRLEENLPSHHFSRANLDSLVERHCMAVWYFVWLKVIALSWELVLISLIYSGLRMATFIFTPLVFYPVLHGDSSLSLLKLKSVMKLHRLYYAFNADLSSFCH
ncbi:hypothetical protein M430DRAFT_252730 [Amorphotheca resinae ATCC 22711]|jgi:hypothetical protein|uniref:Uncharacterized protein n=1 Tax=Amorphotheca resinae ATCC 22711 TaxID=857342 RepID=A0A2T3AXJ0_AMORE|nr:hypothetical protein M430DRAFT_252730 [Amorphotheca resinae ATCC 22711]PSS14775.1 hypothetical protein M430DRAFT_252730 [Amorphotheca resinae ATCC 22711]